MGSLHTDPPTGPTEAIAPAAPRVRRSADDRVLLGVCGGVARRFGVPSRWVRIAFVVLGLAGVGAAAYVTMAIACRAEDDTRPVGAGRIAAALAAGVGTLAITTVLLRAIGIGHAAFARGPVLVIVFLAGVGAALVVGRAHPAGADAAGVAAPARARAWRLPRPHPPVLLLLTVAAAAVAATAAWFATSGPDGVDAFGVMLAAAVVVVGLGVALSAWRGRSHLLLPIGIALAAPLAVAAFADVSLTVGRDNPGVIASADGARRTVVLAQGAGPVQVRAAAVAAGLRTLTVRKGIGRVEVIVDRSVPVRLSVVAGVGSVTVEDFVHNGYWSFRGLRRHSITLAAAGTAATAPLTLNVQVGFGSVLVEHGAPPVVTIPSLADQLRALRGHLVGDIRARRALVQTDRRTLHRLAAAYAQSLRRLGRGPVAAGSRTLGLPESFWRAASLSSPTLLARDPALRRLERLLVLRFNLLRASWRVHAVAQGIRVEQERVRALGRRIAAAEGGRS